MGQRRTHAAGADRSRRQQFPAAVPARSGQRRGRAWCTRRTGATWRHGRCPPTARRSRRSRTIAATPCCASGRWTASARSSPGLPRGVASEPAFVAGRHQPRLHRGGADAFPRRSGCGATAPPARCVQPEAAVDPARFVDLDLVEWTSFDGTRIPGWLALPRGARPRRRLSRGDLGARRAGQRRRGRISAPTFRCCWTRASPC